MVCIQETKIQNMNNSIVRSLGVGRFLDWGAANAEGALGGILVFWDKRSLELVDLEVGLFSVLFRFRNVEDDFLWTFLGIYGPVLSGIREDFWDELGAITGQLGGGGGGSRPIGV